MLFFILGHFLLFYPPKSPKNQNLKKWKEHLAISSFYICVPKIMKRRCMVPEIQCMMDGQTDGWMDGWTDRSDRYRWVPHLKRVPLICDISMPLHRWKIILCLTYVLFTLPWDWWYQWNRPCQRQVYSYSWKMVKLLRKHLLWNLRTFS